MSFLSPEEEARRLERLRETGLLDTPAEAVFDDVVALAALLFEAPIAYVSLVDETRQWFKSAYGFSPVETPRTDSFCVHALAMADPLVVPDAAADSRFANSPLVTDHPGIRFYVGVPLRLEDGVVLGTLAVADIRAREPEAKQLQSLKVLSRQVVTEIQLRLALQNARSAQSLQRIAGNVARLGGWTLRVADGVLVWTEETRAIHEVPESYVPSLESAIEFYPESERARVSENVAACIEKGLPFDFESPLITTTGRRIWVHAFGAAVRDDSGVIISMQGALQDITARKEAEFSAATFEKRLHEQSEALPCIVWTATADGTVDYANQRLIEYSGVSAQADPSTRWYPLVHPDDFHACMREWATSIKSSEPFEIEYRLQRHDGAYRWFRVQAAPIFGEDGKIALWYGTAIDIDDVRQMELHSKHLAKRMTNILESITDAFMTIDPDWRFSYLNPQAYRLLMRAPETLEGRLVFEEFPEALGSVFEEQYRKAFETGHSVVFEAYFPPLQCWFEIRVYPFEQGLAVYFQDVTERRASEERFRLLSIATNDAIWDWDLIHDKVWWNEGFEKMFGFSRAVIEPSSECWTSRIHPDDRDEILASVHAAIEGKSEGWTAEYRFVRMDGSFAHILDRGHILRDAHGRAQRMIGGMMDLTVRKETEQQLRDQATLLDKAQDAIIVRDLNHIILFWNKSAERLYGWTAVEAVGTSVQELLYRDPSAFIQATQTCIGRGEWVGEIEQYTKGNQVILVEGHWSLVLDEDGNPRSILAINTDITERRKLEQQFLRAQRMESIGTLAGGIAHDLNNLLSPIVMGIDLLRRFDPPQKALPVINTIEQSARRGTDLVKQVLSFARGVEGTRVRLQITHLLDELESIISNTFPKNIVVERVIEDQPWPVIGDPTQVNQVLLNLCVNARDAMEEGGRIRIKVFNTEIDSQFAAMDRTATEGKFVVVEISDEGCGMSKEVRERVFEPFFTTKEMGKGTGLGLSTVMGIIRSHGGFVNVYSEVGRGSVFKVYLPSAESVGEEDAVYADGDLHPRGHGECILVVDDEVSILTITKQTLEAFGYMVLIAEDGAQGLVVFLENRQRVSLVLTDMMMPVMDGPTFVRALRRIDARLPIIGASGLNANGSVAKAAAAGIRHFINKPYSTSVILQTVAAVFKESQETPDPA